MVELIFIKGYEKVIFKKVHCRNLDSVQYTIIDRKIVNITRRIFPSMLVPPDFINFRQKIGFKTALKSFASLTAIF